MLFSLSGFDVSRASWEFPEGTCAGYNGKLRMMFMMVIMMTKTMMLMMSMTMTVMTMMMLILVLTHNSKKTSFKPMVTPAQFYF